MQKTKTEQKTHSLERAVRAKNEFGSTDDKRFQDKSLKAEKGIPH